MKHFILLFFMCLFLSSCINTCALHSDASDTITNELKLSEQSKRCKWFLNASEALKAKKINIQSMEKSLKVIESDSTKKGIYFIKSSELDGLKASYNILVGEYNANKKRYSLTDYLECNGKKLEEYETF